MKRKRVDVSAMNVMSNEVCVSLSSSSSSNPLPQHSDRMDSSTDGNRFNLQTPTTMFLRITYWLNSALTKSINAGLCALAHPDVYEPYVMLASANSDGKVFGISHKQWIVLMSRMNDVTSCFINKQKKTVFIDFDLALAVKQMFGKQFVTLFGFTDEDRMSPFLLTEQEWKVMVNQAINISGYLSQLDGEKVTMNQHICDKRTHKSAEDEKEEKDTAPYDRLAEEVKALMRYK